MFESAKDIVRFLRQLDPVPALTAGIDPHQQKWSKRPGAVTEVGGASSHLAVSLENTPT
jgi:hypothetical protein